MRGAWVLGEGGGDPPQLKVGQLQAWVGGPMYCSLVGGAASVMGCTSAGLKQRVLSLPVISPFSWGLVTRRWWSWYCQTFNLSFLHIYGHAAVWVLASCIDHVCATWG
jgi:hypothetical protein